MSSEDKSDANAIDSSKTREFPDVSFDKVLSDNASERMVENKDALCNPKYVQDAFVCCPLIKSIEMDSIMAQAFLKISILLSMLRVSSVLKRTLQ